MPALGHFLANGPITWRGGGGGLACHLHPLFTMPTDQRRWQHLAKVVCHGKAFNGQREGIFQKKSIQSGCFFCFARGSMQTALAAQVRFHLSSVKWGCVPAIERYWCCWRCWGRSRALFHTAQITEMTQQSRTQHNTHVHMMHKSHTMLAF